MPELPEVENVKNMLCDSVKGKTISNITILAPRIIRTPSVEDFQQKVIGQTIIDVHRKGKHLIFLFKEGVIVSHLRMEGKYHLAGQNEKRDKHDHVIFHFDDDTELRYNDVRKFGTMDYVNTPEEVNSVKELGLEPNESTLTGEYLHKAFQQKKTTVKNALLEQSIVAGLGNIYVDEVCFAAKIHPQRLTNSLSFEECTVVCSEIKRIIALAIQMGGSSVRTYDSMGKKGSMQDFHQVYNKKDKPCTRCETPIEKIKLHGRGTHYCPNCQRL